MPEVKILSEVKLVLYPTPEKPEQVVAVTYQTGFMPPRTVYIKSDEYNPDKVRETIKADLNKATTEKPKTMEV